MSYHARIRTNATEAVLSYVNGGEDGVTDEQREQIEQRYVNTLYGALAAAAGPSIRTISLDPYAPVNTMTVEVTDENENDVSENYLGTFMYAEWNALDAAVGSVLDNNDTREV